MRLRSFVNAVGAVVLCLGVCLLPQGARAQSAAAQLPPAAGDSFTNARIAFISIGALTGIIVANTLTDGLVMPVLNVTRVGAAPALAALQGTASFASQEAMEALVHAAQARYYLVEASRVALTFAGAVGGGYVGYWLNGGR
jgi:hypothetical protein